jgi:glycosyltransferase involved in cell wall biosynthesis
MVRYSVLIPERDSLATVKQLLPQLCQTLQSLVLPYEVICIDDASAGAATENLEALLTEYPALRVLRFDQPRGTSAALGAGMLAARGNIVIALDANSRFPLWCIAHLIARLSQHDLVVARAEQSLAGELARPFSRLARLAARSQGLRGTEDLFWAARREALYGLTLSRGAFRAMPDLVAARGFRVCELRFASGLPPQGTPLRPNLARHIVARWAARPFEPHLASELVRGDLAGAEPAVSRVDAPPPRWIPQAVAVPLQTNRDTA